jgi:hypothetical protein
MSVVCMQTAALQIRIRTQDRLAVNSIRSHRHVRGKVLPGQEVPDPRCVPKSLVYVACFRTRKSAVELERPATETKWE